MTSKVTSSCAAEGERLANTLLQHLVRTHHLKDQLPTYPAGLQFQLLGLSQALSKLHSWLEQSHVLLTDEHVTHFQERLDSCSSTAEEFGKELDNSSATDAEKGERRKWGEVFRTYELKFHPHILYFYAYLRAFRCSTPEESKRILNQSLPERRVLDDNESSLTGNTLTGAPDPSKAKIWDDGLEKPEVNSDSKPKFRFCSFRQHKSRKSVDEKTITKLFFQMINIFYLRKSPTQLGKYCEKGSKFHVRRLLFSGADLEAVDSLKRTPLHKAVDSYHAKIACILLKWGANVDAQDYNGWTPLHRAAASGNKPSTVDVMRNLLEFKASLSIAENLSGKRPLHVAAGSSFSTSPELIRMLLDYGADTESEDQDFAKPLHYATRMKAFGNINALLAAGADINSKNLGHETALHMALDAQHEPLVKSLMDAGADINAIDVRWNTPLHKAAQFGHVGLIKTLAAADAKIEPEVTLLHTPLHTAVLWNKPNAVKALLEAGSDPNPRGCFGQTPLTLACQDGRLDSATALLEFGADRTLEQGSPRGIVAGNALACARRWKRSAELTRLLSELDGERNEEEEEEVMPANAPAHVSNEAWIGKFVVQVYERKGNL